MTRKFALCTICLTVLIGITFSVGASAEIAVGVKEGDWIEYNVTFTGDVPVQHDVTWCRFDVAAVDGENVYVDVTWTYSDGSNETVSETIKLGTDHIGEAFIIPANSDKGDTFSSYEGNITISGAEEKNCAGATRKVVYANTPETMFYWDMSTGFLVEANSSYPEYTLFTKVEKTNMWQTQIFGLDQTVFIALVALVLVAVLAVAILLIRKRKK